MKQQKVKEIRDRKITSENYSGSNQTTWRNSVPKNFPLICLLKQTLIFIEDQHEPQNNLSIYVGSSEQPYNQIEILHKLSTITLTRDFTHA